MNHQPKLDNNVTARVRISAFVPRAIADKLDTAALRLDLSSSGYIAAALVRHCAALDLFADGVDGHEIAKLLHMTYPDVMAMLGRQIDDAAKDRWP